MIYEIKNNFHVHLNCIDLLTSKRNREERKINRNGGEKRAAMRGTRNYCETSRWHAAQATRSISRGVEGGRDDDVPRPNFYRRNKWIRVLPIRWPRMATRHGAMIPRPVNIERMAIDVPNTYIHVYIGKRCCIDGKQGRSFRERE